MDEDKAVKANDEREGDEVIYKVSLKKKVNWEDWAIWPWNWNKSQEENK